MNDLLFAWQYPWVLIWKPPTSCPSRPSNTPFRLPFEFSRDRKKTQCPFTFLCLISFCLSIVSGFRLIRAIIFYACKFPYREDDWNDVTYLSRWLRCYLTVSKHWNLHFSRQNEGNDQKNEKRKKKKQREEGERGKEEKRRNGEIKRRDERNQSVMLASDEDGDDS